MFVLLLPKNSEVGKIGVCGADRGKYRKKGWWGYKIIYDPTESEDEEDESTD